MWYECYLTVLWSRKVNNPITLSISAQDTMLTSISMGGADILLEPYKRAPAVDRKHDSIKNEKSEVKYTVRDVLIFFSKWKDFYKLDILVCWDTLNSDTQ